MRDQETKVTMGAGIDNRISKAEVTTRLTRPLHRIISKVLYILTVYKPNCVYSCTKCLKNKIMFFEIYST